MRKSDLYAGVTIGVAIALLFPVIARNIDVAIPPQWMLVIVAPILTLFGLYLAHLLARMVPVIYQIAKFALVGALNTTVDFGVANFLILVTGISVGVEVSLFKAISFAVAVVNSYFWNKFWTFRSKEGVAAGTRGGGVGQFSQFLAVSIVGLVINVGVASLVINTVSPVAGLSTTQWANVGFLAATFTALAWNFVGYKFFVFKKR